MFKSIQQPQYWLFSKLLLQWHHKTATTEKSTQAEAKTIEFTFHNVNSECLLHMSFSVWHSNIAVNRLGPEIKYKLMQKKKEEKSKTFRINSHIFYALIPSLCIKPAFKTSFVSTIS